MSRTAADLALLAALAAIAPGCERAPLDPLCPDILPGALAISELRGAQSGGAADPWGQWIEIYNSTGSSISLTGLAVTLRKINGSSEGRILVRSPDATIPALGYAVLGQFAMGQEPTHVTYGYAGDFPDSLYSAAQVELSSCGRVIDQMVYRSLPTQGTLCLDGTEVPDSVANDDESAWCTDAEGTDHPGTPLMRNPPCAP